MDIIIAGDIAAALEREQSDMESEAAYQLRWVRNREVEGVEVTQVLTLEPTAPTAE
jgi:hypothetical protein